MLSAHPTYLSTPNLADSFWMSWNNESPLSWSLLDVLKAYAHIYTAIGSSLLKLAKEAEVALPHSLSRAKAFEWITLVLKDISTELSGTPLVMSKDMTDTILDEISHAELFDDVPTRLRFLQETLESELKRMMFLYLPSPNAAAYESPLSGYRGAIKAFPSIQNTL